MGAEQKGPRGFTIVGEGEAPAPAGKLPPIDFGTLVLSISTSALVQLGEAPSPDSGEPIEPDLALARQTIEILEMLQVKTRGNLEPEEERLLEGVLHDLHMRFVEARKRVR
jgi:hypothetical protein